jgi:hypothetical protein
MIDLEGRRAIVISADDIGVLDYSQIVERDASELTYSQDGQQLYFQYDEPDLPDFIPSLSYAEGPYDYDAFQIILGNSRWSGQDSALDDTSVLRPVFF